MSNKVKLNIIFKNDVTHTNTLKEEELTILSKTAEIRGYPIISSYAIFDKKALLILFSYSNTYKYCSAIVTSDIHMIKTFEKDFERVWTMSEPLLHRLVFRRHN